MESNERNIVKIFEDGSYFFYSHGSKDNWKLSYCTCFGKVCQLYDNEYLAMIQELGKFYGNKRIYDVFVQVYNLVTKNGIRNKRHPKPNCTDFDVISKIVNNLPETHYYSSLRIEKLFCCLYLTMISEWYYENTRLYHRIKRLGVYQVLFLNWDANLAANFSKGKGYIELDDLMKRYGF